MAIFNSTFLRVVDVDEGSGQVTQFYQLNIVDAISDGVFSVGEDITAIYNSTSHAFNYVGQLNGGWLGEFVLTPGEYRYFSNQADVPDAPVAYSTADFVVCFLAGTRIAVPGGETAVETLAIGDRVLTADGRAAPVRFVGRQTVASPFADPLRAYPIRIAAGALGEGLPTRDLLVSPDHALLLDDVLVQAGALVNDMTIVREAAMPERFTYFHVELADHSLILAEGVPAETFVDNVTRRRFDNFAEFAALYGDEAATIAERDLPRIKSARQLPKALRARLGLEVARAA